MYTHVLTPFTARDGENLALYHWKAEESGIQPGYPVAPARGVILIVHGLGEHAGRYDHVANFLCNWGFEVRAYDQRGHGESAGLPGTLPSSNALLDDLAEVLDDRMIFSVGESRERSVYRVGSTELRFQMKAEANFPVALASLFCKYVRELSMQVFNEFWAEHVSGLKPTAGYPVDAVRFKQDIAEAQARLAITDDVLWRER